MKYSIVIPTYNHCNDLLHPCIDSIFKYTKITDIEIIVSANGCTDHTEEYLSTLKEHFDNLGLGNHLKIVWNDEPLGYSRACNAGIEVATTDLIVLLNNDTVLLEQPQNRWLNLLEAQFIESEKCGISCIVKSESEPAGHDFAIFFCVMIHRKVFDKIGLLSLDYGAGGGEDTEFSIECERAGFEVRECVVKEWSHQANMYVGNFPMYHKGEGTVHDKELVPEWDEIFLTNSLTLARKYNPKWYQWRLSNYWERAVFFKGDDIAPREITRYSWAAQNILGTKVFELGCSSGYGLQFLPDNIEYTGLDYDKRIIPVARDQKWRENATFVHGDINTYELGQYDTIIAFEVIEHLENGLEIVEKLKKHCKRLMITVPMLETPGLWGPHHKIHNLDESFFPSFKFKFIAPDGSLRDEPHNRGDKENINLMLCVWDKEEELVTQPIVLEKQLKFLRDINAEIYDDVIEKNTYDVSFQDFNNKTVIDIGANIGVFALLSASMGAKQVLAVEPVSSTYDMLLSNVKRTEYQQIVSMKKAVSANTGELLKISLNENNGHNSMYNVTDSFEEVSTITLHDILTQTNDNNIILKLDCEGAEYDIILTAVKEDMDRIGKIIIEMHPGLHDTYNGVEILQEKLKEFGFKQINYKQMYEWKMDNTGVVYETVDLPYRVEMWDRNTTIDEINYKQPKINLEFLKKQHPSMYTEVVEANQYQLTEQNVKGRVVVDIGAHIGAFSLYAASLGAKEIIAVEPTSVSYNTFLNNIYNTGLSTITTHKKLVSSKGKQFVKVSLNPESGANSMFNVRDAHEIVETITFSDIMDSIHDTNVLLKLDCEGAEYDIILGATADTMAKIDEIAIEIHTDLHPTHKGATILNDKLTEFGFTCIKNSQIYYWDIDSQGNRTNWRLAPFVNQHWKK